MSKRKLGNLIKRQLQFLGLGGILREKTADANNWARRQFEEFSKLGGQLIVMRSN